MTLESSQGTNLIPSEREHIEAICVYFDGLCEPVNPGGIATYGLLIIKGKTRLLEDHGLAFAVPWTDEASNNVAEYSALIKGLEWLKNKGMLNEQIVVRGDSSLVINQLSGKFKVKGPRILELYKKARDLLLEFQHLKIEWVDRSINNEADLLSRIAYSKAKKKYPKPSSN